MKRYQKGAHSFLMPVHSLMAENGRLILLNYKCPSQQAVYHTYLQNLEFNILRKVHL